MQLPLLLHHSSSAALLLHSPLRDAASSPPSNSFAALLRSPLRDAASSPSSAALLSTISYSVALLWSPLRDAASSPPLLSAALLSSISALLHLTPLLLPSSDLHCVMQLPLLLSHLQLSYPLHDAASSPPSISSPPSLPSAAWCSFLSSSAALLHHSSSAALSPPPFSTAWCSFLSSSLICSSPLLHLTPLLLPSSDIHCVMQLPLLSHLQLSSPPLQLSFPPSNSFAAPHLRSPLRDAASSPLSSAALLSSISLLLCSSPFLHQTPLLLSSNLHCVMQLPLLPHLQLSSPPSLLSSI